MTSEVAVLIGTGSIGVAIARRSATGRILLLADLNEKQLEVTAEQLRNEGYIVETQPTDVSNEEAVRSLADRAASLGKVACVVHAAGVSPNQAPPAKIISVDLLGSIHVIEEFGKVIGDGGSGVVIASQAGHMGERLPVELENDLATKSASEIEKLPAVSEISNSGVAYMIAKRANTLRVQAAAMTWALRGARINSISPGIICTPLARHEMAGPDAKAYSQMIEKSPARRMGNPSEVGELASFLLDHRGSFITGADILMDGGVISLMKSGGLNF